MIEKDFLEYLASQSMITSLVGTNIFYSDVPTTAKMPWIVFTVSGGYRTKKTLAGKSEESLTLTVYCDAAERIQSKTIANAVMAVIEGYRGDFGDNTKDTIWTASSARDLLGWNGSKRQLLSFYPRHWYTTNNPN